MCSGASEPRSVTRGLRGDDGRNQVERFSGVPGPALGQGVGPDHGSGLGV